MKNIMFFGILVLVILSKDSLAQEKPQLSINEQKKLIASLIKKREIDDSISNWKNYLDAVVYRPIFKNTLQQQSSEIFIFCSKSSHADYFLLLKGGGELQILDCNSLSDDMNILLDFFKKNVGVDSKKILETFGKINEAYLHNQSNSQKIPIQ